jgi:elongation factor G
MAALEPIIFVEVKPNTWSDQEKLSEGLRRLIIEDPTFRINSDVQTSRTIIHGMGELHLEIIIDRLRREFKVEMTVGRPQVEYKETLTQIAEGEGRCVRRIGGRDHYALARIRIFPGEAGSGCFFQSRVTSDVIPEKFIKSIDEGIKEALIRGILGYRVDDIQVELYDGSFHDVDSSELAFRIAGTLALQDAAKRARPVLLEPIMAVEIVVPEEFVGHVTGDLNSRRGHIEGLELRGTEQIIKVSAPPAEMFGYASDLRLRTQGRASYSMHFDRYKPLPSGDYNNDDEYIAPVVVPRIPTPRGKDSGVAIPKPDSG